MTRREMLNRSATAGFSAAWAQSLTGCGSWRQAGFQSVPVIRPVRVDVVEVNPRSGMEDDAVTKILAHTFPENLRDVTIAIQTASPKEPRGGALAEHRPIVSLIADSLVRLGVRIADIHQNIGVGAPVQLDLKAGRAAGTERVYLKRFCATRYSGLLHIEIPRCLSEASKLVAITIVEDTPQSPLASRLLSSWVRHSSKIKFATQSGEEYVIDIACTLKPAYYINVLVVDRDNHSGYKMICGTGLAAVDATTLRELGLDHCDAALIANLPCWLGPTAESMIERHFTSLL